MPKVFLPLGKMNLDRGPVDGDHSWVIKDFLATADGYDQAPALVSATNWAIAESTNPRGGINWRGGGAARMYVGTTSQLWEVSGTTSTDVSRTSGGSYTNNTNGPSFAAYGGKCYMSNGIDRINSITVPSAIASTTNFSDMTYTTDGAVIAPKYICSHKNHLVGANIKMLEGYGEIDSVTSTAGIDFAAQPLNDSIEILSSAAGDTTQTISIVGTTFGTDTVVNENMLLNGTNVVTSVKSNWGIILRVTCNAANVGTITVREASGNFTVATIPISGAAQHVGNFLTNVAGGDTYVTLYADGASTAQIGIEGTDANGVAIVDSQALNGATAVQSNLKFRTVTALYIGDLESTRTVTIESHQFGLGDTYEHLLWISGTDLPEGYGDPQVAPQITGSDYRYLFDGLGTISGVIDGGDCFFVFKTGSIYRLDGPPFQPTVINYNVGMRAGCVAYRMGDRIYFWSSKGLSYIDIKSNEVVHVFEDVLQRSILDAGSSSSDENSKGFFPQQEISNVSAVGAGKLTSRASIAGDPEYGLIFITYVGDATSYYGITDAALICYNERLNSFSLLNGPVGTSPGAPLVLDYDNDADISYPGSVIRIFRVTSALTLTMYYFVPTVLSSLTGVNAPYIRYPFKSVEPESSRTRITRVRPIFDNLSWAVGSAPINGTRIEVLSISGIAKYWPEEALLSIGTETVSNDGWISVSDCKYADKHSIGVHFESNRQGSPVLETRLIIGSLIGIEVEFELNPSRTL